MPRKPIFLTRCSSLRSSAGSVIEMLAIGNRRVGRVRGVLSGPVVVGAVGVALELVVRVAEQGHAVAAVEDLGADAIEVHVLEALDRIPAAGAADRIAAAGELLVLLGRDAGVAEAGRVERAQRLTGEEIPRLPVVLVDQVRRPVAELAPACASSTGRAVRARGNLLKVPGWPSVPSFPSLAVLYGYAGNLSPSGGAGTSKAFTIPQRIP